MSKYLITKRDDCDECEGKGFFNHTQFSGRVVTIDCNRCYGQGYIDTQVELSAVLASNTAIAVELKRALGTY